MSHSTSPAVEAITSNPLRKREDMIALLLSLLKPLQNALSPGGARVRLGCTGTHYDSIAAEMEGYTRALWGLAPLLAAEPDRIEFRDLAESWRKGLESGTNPENEEYWGECDDKDQRFVEMAAIGYALAIAPKAFWEPLTPETKIRVNEWLSNINRHELPLNNWYFFRVMVNLGLKSVGAEYSQPAIDDSLDTIDKMYGEDGFPADGVRDECKAFDYYATGFAFPFYSLVYSSLTEDSVRSKVYRQRALQNIPAYINFFAPNGASIPFGRSLTYRFATSCFWGALAFDNFELPQPYSWGVVKGLLLRNIRWFTQNPQIFNQDGSLSIGYSYPNFFMSEDYNSPQSPYWALKSFIVLALPEAHPFWQAKEEPYPQTLLERPFKVVKPWMQVFTHAAGHTFCLTSGQYLSWPMRGSTAKYGKMAYSCSFGFSVPTGASGLQQHVPDSTLAVSDDGGEIWLPRRLCQDVSVSDKGVVRSTWCPWSDTQITTWLFPPSSNKIPWHTRIHQIASPRRLRISDAGFSIHSTYGQEGNERRLKAVSSLPISSGRYENLTSAIAVSRVGVSGVINLLPDQGAAEARIQDADGNSNLISPRTVFPTVISTHDGKEDRWLASRIFAQPFAGGQGAVGDERNWTREWENASKGWERDFELENVVAK